jgi:hypothetical protein
MDSRFQGPFVQGHAQTGSSATASGSLSVVTLNGDLLVAILYLQGTAGVQTAPSGWVLQQTESDPNGGSVRLYSKVTTGGAATPQWTLTTSTPWIVQILEFTGVGTTVDQKSKSTSGSLLVAKSQSGTTAALTGSRDLVVAGLWGGTSSTAEWRKWPVKENQFVFGGVNASGGITAESDYRLTSTGLGNGTSTSDDFVSAHKARGVIVAFR